MSLLLRELHCPTKRHQGSIGKTIARHKARIKIGLMPSVATPRRQRTHVQRGLPPLGRPLVAAALDQCIIRHKGGLINRTPAMPRWLMRPGRKSVC